MAWIPNLEEPGTADVETKGVDIFQLLKVDNDWKIVSLTNEVIRPGVPIPDELIKKAEDGWKNQYRSGRVFSECITRS